MKAMVTTKYGPPEVLQIKEIEKPVPKTNEVLVKIRMTTVSTGDVKMRGLDLPTGQKIAARLFLGFTKPRKDILGMEIAGEIEEVGEDVTKFKVGDEVIASTFWVDLGGYAQYKCMPEDDIIAVKPSNMSFEQAVPVLGGGLTAAKVLKIADIQVGQRVLIYGASGNVGTYAVQIAKHLGAVVTGVCSTRNLELVKSLGADKVIDYTTEDFSKSGETYDVIFDAIDKLTPEQWKASLKETGIHLNVNKHSGGVGRSKDHLEYMFFLKDLMEEGKIQSVIDKTYTFRQIPEAHKYVETGRKRGCVVVIVDQD
ncbi:MAG: NADPH:quinone oxidoreductase [Candidatus Thorarchaeota archaeon SMTZ-45]|nr:MAG: NADPH:quinone oxidoreductase [Candidatus Thorarchaeota archaeon SMTZ-45]KXH75565.1 MAG: NADPH:quinone oxidoreductase [Candidatus Thorarchaeota archaeon SMTZ1-45]